MIHPKPQAPDHFGIRLKTTFKKKSLVSRLGQIRDWDFSSSTPDTKKYCNLLSFPSHPLNKLDYNFITQTFEVSSCLVPPQRKHHTPHHKLLSSQATSLAERRGEERREERKRGSTISGFVMRLAGLRQRQLR